MVLGHNDSGYQERIRSRYQTSFWKNFIKYFESFGSQAYKYEKLKVFENVFLKLIDQIIKNLTVSNEDTFQEFNYQNMQEDIFDEYFNNKRDLGKLIKLTAELIGVNEIL